MLRSQYRFFLCILLFSGFTSVAQHKTAGFADKLRSRMPSVLLSGQPHAPVEHNLLGSPLSVLTFTASAIEKALPIQFKFAQILDSDVESVTNTRLFSFIDSWWGTRYRYGGESKSGIDCSAFAGLLMREVFNMRLPRTASEQFSNISKVDKKSLREGDLVFFNTRGGISHVGIFLKHGYFVHASTSRGVTISNLEESYYKSRFLGGGRWKGEKPHGLGLFPFPGFRVFAF